MSDFEVGQRVWIETQSSKNVDWLPYMGDLVGLDGIIVESDPEDDAHKVKFEAHRNGIWYDGRQDWFDGDSLSLHDEQPEEDE